MGETESDSKQSSRQNPFPTPIIRDVDVVG